MAGCRGTLVVHEDGTPVWCSEELDGNTCTGDVLERHRSVLSCRVTFRLGCPDCRRDEVAGMGAVHATARGSSERVSRSQQAGGRA